MNKSVLLTAWFVLLVVAASGCAAPTPTATPQPTPQPSATPVPATATSVPPTATRVPPTPTLGPPTATPTTTPTATPTVTPTPITLKGMADDVTRGVGKVIQVVEGDPQKVIFVFDEDHRSRLGLVEIASMLNRLYTQYRVRHFGLEGHAADKPPLNLAWAQRKPYFQPGQKVTAREDVIVQTLKDGEISSAEMMGLIYADVVVHGVDDAKLYAVEQAAGSSAAFTNYLFQLAYAFMNREQRAQYQALYDQKKLNEAFNYVVNTHKVTATIWARFNDFDNVASAEEKLELLNKLDQEIQNARVGISPDSQAGFNAYREFGRVTSARSDAMAANMLKVAAASTNPGAPLALVGLGTDHSQRVVELLTKAGASVVHIRPLSWIQKNTPAGGWISNEAYARKNQGRSVAPAGPLGALLDGRRKPPPVADQDWYKQEQAILEYMQELAAAAANQQTITDYQQAAALNALAEQWRDQLSVAGISDAYLSQINVSTSPPTVRSTFVLQDGRTISGDVQLDLGKLNALDLDGLINQSLDNWKTGSTETQQISSNAQVFWIGTGIPDYHQNPDWWTREPDGSMSTVLADGTKVTQSTDGTKTVYYPDGTKVTESKDGKKVTVKPDGTTVTEWRDGTKVTVSKDGSKSTTYPDGTKVTIEPDGTKVTEKDGTKVSEYPDGTSVTVRPDGTRVTEP